jgi:hypothetical protein
MADFLTFQMPVLIDANSFFVSNCLFVWKSRGIHSLRKVAVLYNVRKTFLAVFYCL